MYKITFQEGNRGTILTPYIHNAYRNDEILEVNFRELYEGMFSFAKYGVLQFNIKANSIEEAIELAKVRLDNIFSNGDPNRIRENVIVSGFKYDENNNKIPYNPPLAKIGDLLKYVGNNDGYGFWYIVDSNGKRISNEVKSGIFESLFADGVIKKH